jgi:hypothetical protein
MLSEQRPERLHINNNSRTPNGYTDMSKDRLLSALDQASSSCQGLCLTPISRSYTLSCETLSIATTGDVFCSLADVQPPSLHAFTGRDSWLL